MDKSIKHKNKLGLNSFGMVLVVIISFLLSYMKESSAQEVPTTAEPERLEKRFEPPAVPKSTLEQVVPVIPEPTEPLAPSELEKIKFIFKGLKIEGATIYSDADLHALYEKGFGREVALVEIYWLAREITKKYRNDGYILSRAIVPPQRIEDGVALIRVIEGYIDNVDIEGAVEGRHKLLESYAEKIKRSKPLHITVLERYLMLMNDLAGANVKSVLNPSAQNPGAANLTLIVSHQHWDGFGSVDNRGSRYAGPFEGTTGLNLNSLLGLYDNTSIQSVVTYPTSEMVFLYIAHQQPIGSEGMKLTFTATASDTESGYDLKSLGVKGKSSSYSLSLTKPYIRTRKKNLSLDLGFSFKNSRNDIIDTINAKDRLRVLKLGGSFDFIDKFNAINLMTLQASKGLDIFNPTKTGSANLSRARGKHDFFKLSGTLMRLQKIGAGFNFHTQMDWQYSFDQLLSSEEFGVGGAGSARAYDASTITGIHGAAWKAELQKAGKVNKKYFKDYQLYGFFDHGIVWHKDPDAGTPSKEHLSSWGGGVRFNFTDTISGYTEVGVPISRDVATYGNRDPRFFFNIVKRFSDKTHE